MLELRPITRDESDAFPWARFGATLSMMTTVTW
jgi:hypothetical protein